MAILGRRQPHAPIILRAGGQPSVAQLVQVSRQSVNTAVVRFHPRVQVIVSKAGGQPSVASLLQVSKPSINTATTRYHPPVQVVIKRAGGQPSTAQIVQVSRPSINTATARFHPPVQVTIKRAGGQPSIARLLQLSQAAVNAAISRFHLRVQVVIKVAGGSAVVVVPIAGKIVQVSKVAVNVARPRVNQPIIKNAGGPAAIVAQTGARFFVPRDPLASTRSRQHMDAVQMILNSLAGQGYVRLSGLQTFTITGGCLQVARPPTVHDDISVNIQPGMIWQNTLTNGFYICRSNAVGAAVWAFIV
jgi:hypothetical protein